MQAQLTMDIDADHRPPPELRKIYCTCKCKCFITTYRVGQRGRRNCCDCDDKQCRSRTGINCRSLDGWELVGGYGRWRVRRLSEGER